MFDPSPHKHDSVPVAASADPMPYPYHKVPEPKYESGGLFRPVRAGESGAYVGLNRTAHALALYSSGYFESAYRLGQRLMVNDGNVDTEVYPLLYLYRHAVELSIKYIHRVMQSILNTDTRFKTTHLISDNWSSVRPNLELLLQEAEFAPKTNLEVIDRILRDLVAVDPKAEAFRFPQVSSGAEVAADLGSINLHAFCDALEYVAAELTQLIEWLHDVHPGPLLWE
jgi:hypothetical protein